MEADGPRMPSLLSAERLHHIDARGSDGRHEARTKGTGEQYTGHA